MEILTPFPPASPPQPRRPAGFWRRFLAFVLDGFIAAFVCGLIGFGFYSFFSSSPATAMLVGFVLTWPYFATMGSSVGGGQTIGHRLADIEVVDQQGKTISLGRSCLRYLILLTPFLWNSDALAFGHTVWVKSTIDSLFLGMEVAIFYLYIFNRRTRQSLHDLLTDTYVVEAGSLGGVDTPRFWAGHWAILGGGVLVGAVLLTGLGPRIGETGPFPELTAIQRAVLESGKVRSVGVSIRKNWVNGETSTGIDVSVAWKGQPNIDRNAAEIADLVMRTDSHAAERDFVTVRFIEGFRIGFATFSKNQQESHKPAEWLREFQTYRLR